MADTKYVVAARVGTNYEDCIVAPEGSMIIGTHRIVYGPASRAECEAWKQSHCK